MVFAVKPQMLAAALPHYEGFAANGAAALSIAAGWRLAGFEAALGAKTPVVRAMPNTPAAVGRGMTVLCANKNAENKLRDLCGELLATVGETAWVEDEGLKIGRATSELQSLMRTSYAIFCFNKKKD